MLVGFFRLTVVRNNSRLDKGRVDTGAKAEQRWISGKVEKVVRRVERYKDRLEVGRRKTKGNGVMEEARRKVRKTGGL